MITRRLALFRIASASAVAATAAAPVALAAVQPKTPENPALLRLGRKLEKLDAIRQHCTKVKAAALDAYSAARPEIPADLLATHETKQIAGSERECDFEGNAIWPDDPAMPPRQYHTSDCLRRGLENFGCYDDDELDDEERADRDKLLLLLPLAEQFERQTDAAAESSGIRRATTDHFRAGHALETVAWKIAAIPAQTPDGITIKARVYEALASCGAEQKYKAAQIIGPKLAEDICRVLSEGG